MNNLLNHLMKHSVEILEIILGAMLLGWIASW